MTRCVRFWPRSSTHSRTRQRKGLGRRAGGVGPTLLTLMPWLVASFTASSSSSNCGSKDTVHAQSMMRPGGPIHTKAAGHPRCGHAQKHRQGHTRSQGEAQCACGCTKAAIEGRDSWRGVCVRGGGRAGCHRTIDLRPEVHLHDVPVVQHGAVSDVGCVVRRNVVEGAAGGESDATLPGGKVWVGNTERGKGGGEAY